MKIKLTYVHHSCYTLETEKEFIVFDYYKGDLKIPEDKNVYFFVSHAHEDHYSPVILKYRHKAKYIVSSDVDLAEKPGSVIRMNPLEEKTVDNMNIKTYISTDEGVAFLIKLEDKNIYYAGDLNNWYWEMEEGEEQRLDMNERYTGQLKLISKTKPIDLSFVVVDPRQEGQWDLGGRQALEKLNPLKVFPMHFWEDFKLTEKFKEKYSSQYPNTKIYSIENKNQEFEIEI